jgi:methionine-S-sulfoxide reductase
MKPMVLASLLFLNFQNSVLAADAKAAPKNVAAKTEMATFAAGCFWGTEEFFRKVPGVVRTEVGYTGGTKDHPKYEDLHDDSTGHAESVNIEFDPHRVSYEKLLDLFFKMHDPTTLNRQGNDVGTQYRSAIFYHGDEQKKIAMNFKAKVEKSGAWKAPIVTEIKEAKIFWRAEDYHQQYLFNKRGTYDNHYLRNISFDKPAKGSP